MTADEFLKQYHDNNPNDWLYQKKQVIAKLLKEYASQQRIEGVKEGFEAARANGKVFNGRLFRICLTYPTVDDYLSTKR